jgi:hypothetical protein
VVYTVTTSGRLLERRSRSATSWCVPVAAAARSACKRRRPRRARRADLRPV